MSAPPSLSFVLPAFDEADNIEAAVERCLAVGQGLQRRFEVVVVDDGSTDGTGALVRRMAARDRRVRVLQHAHNQGYGGALATGLAAARMELIFFTDADLQFDVGQLVELLPQAERHDIVAGYRCPRRDGWIRRLNGIAWSRLVGLLFGTGVRDVDCAFKIFRRPVLEGMAIKSRGAFINAEILARARAGGATLIEVPVRHFRRPAGRPTGARPQVIATAFRELLAVGAELRALPVRADQGELGQRLG